MNYGKSNEAYLPACVRGFLADCADPNPMIRALALRTMAYIQSPLMFDAMVVPLRRVIRDKDPYVRKTAAMCIAKMYIYDRRLVHENQFIESLRDMLVDENSTVVSNAVAALYDITERSDEIQLCINYNIAGKLVAILGQCSEWGQTYILEILLFFVPESTHQAEQLAERVSVHLQQTSASVILTACKAILYLMNYVASAEFRKMLSKKMSAALVTLLTSPPELQYVALRNILLIVQRRPLVLHHDIKFFFCKYNDPLYIKVTKLEIIGRLVHEDNALVVLPELQDYASEIDVDFARKAVSTIGRIALRLEKAADKYVDVLRNMLDDGAPYVVQEVIIVAKDIFRKYPNRYVGLLKILCEHLGALDEPQAKVAMIWILGQYAERIENSEELLDDFLYTFLEEPVEIQLALLTATVKLFLKRPNAGSALVPKVLKWATQDVKNPDCRDRGFMYWRLLSSDPAIAKKVVLTELPVIDTNSERLDRQLLDQLLLQGNSLASVFHRLPQTFIKGAKGRYLADSPALESSARRYASHHLYYPPMARPTITAPAGGDKRTARGPDSPRLLPEIEGLQDPNDSNFSEVSITETDEDVTPAHLPSSTSFKIGRPSPSIPAALGSLI